MQDQQDYDRIASLIPNDQVANQFGTVQGNEKYMLGLHSEQLRHRQAAVGLH